LLAAKIPVALQGFWVMRGRLSEGRDLLRTAQALPAIQESDLARAHILYAAAALAYSQGEAAEAQELLQTCLALQRRLGDDAGTATTLSTLSMAYLATGHAEEAMAAELEASALFVQRGRKVGEAIGLQHQGHILIFQGQMAAARRQVQQALTLAQSLKNREIEGECEWLLAEVAQAEGDRWGALAHLQRALQIARLVGDRSGEAKALGGLGRHSLQQGDVEVAREQLGQAMRAFQAYEMRTELIDNVEDHAALAQAIGSPELSVRLLAAAQHERAQVGLVVSPALQAHTRARLTELRRELGDEAFAQAWNEGGTYSLQTAVSAAANATLVPA
jgi:tetratricopeptide (TPR) repeat protein